jgi:hypothetical protein
MIQLVRIGSPVTATGKTRVLELMRNRETFPVRSRAPGPIRRRVFYSAVADQLTPMLRKKIEPPERPQPIDMLKAAASAYEEAAICSAKPLRG